jgi:hypothetical protein
LRWHTTKRYPLCFSKVKPFADYYRLLPVLMQVCTKMCTKFSDRNNVAQADCQVDDLLVPSRRSECCKKSVALTHINRSLPLLKPHEQQS